MAGNPLLRNSLKRCRDAGNGDCDFFHNLLPKFNAPRPKLSTVVFQIDAVATDTPAETALSPQESKVSPA